MTRPRTRRPAPLLKRAVSASESARLKAMRDELWSRCVELQAIVPAKQKAADLAPAAPFSDP